MSSSLRVTIGKLISVYKLQRVSPLTQALIACSANKDSQSLLSTRALFRFLAV